MHHATPARDDESTVIPLRGRVFPETALAAVDPNDLNSPHTLAVLSIAPGSTVLDVGCGPGVVARALTARGCKVWGVEPDPVRANSARNHCVEVLEADVEAVSLSQEFAGRSFDVILFLDVLEHLRDPRVVLAGAEAVLAPGGSILLSVPNVTHGALRLELLSGKFRYRASGLLDRGHLRFFDAEGLDALIRQAGLRAESRLRVTRRLDQTEFDVDLASIPGDLRTTLERDPDALTYQFFVIARPARAPQPAHQEITLVERQHARIAELTTAIEEGAAYGRHLQEELGARDARLREIEAALRAKDERLREIEASVANSDQARHREFAAAIEHSAAYARHLQEELGARDARLREIEASIASTDQVRYSELAAAIEQGAAYARHLQEELTAKDARLREIEASVANTERARFDELAAAVERSGTSVTCLREDVAAARARLAELQDALTSAERDIAAKTARIVEVEGSLAGLERQRDASATSARELEVTVRRLERECELRDLRLSETERAFADLTRNSEDSEAYVRHLEGELRKRTGDIAIRDDEMRVLRTHIEKTERTISDRDRDIADRDAALQDLRERVVNAETSIADQDALRNSIGVAERRVAELDARLHAADRSGAESRVLADQLFTLLQQPRHRFAERSNDALKRWMPLIHRLLRPLFASATRHAPTTPDFKLDVRTSMPDQRSRGAEHPRA
jgi:2-polyprenyl-3-methyl-5-hydroxy-6-metoxy-1,4-benzoquinol methylase